MSDAGDDDDWPSMASPEIQVEYEAALGSFLVKFNRIENLATTILMATLSGYGRADLADIVKDSTFNAKLLQLELLSLAEGENKHLGLPYSALRQLNANRNMVAHGHFEQNPFDGDYQIVSKNKPHDITTDTLKTFAASADTIWDRLRHSQAMLWFKEVVLPD